jgi:hypothetical protein
MQVTDIDNDALQRALTGGYTEDSGDLPVNVSDIRAGLPKPAPEPLPAPKGPKSISRLHAIHRASVDVYDDGDPAHAHLRGEWVVEYLPTIAGDPSIKATIEALQATNDEQALWEFMVDYLERSIYAWNLDDPVSRESIIALKPVLQWELIQALMRASQAKK